MRHYNWRNADKASKWLVVVLASSMVYLLLPFAPKTSDL
jgi:hypothetical protein